MRTAPRYHFKGTNLFLEGWKISRCFDGSVQKDTTVYQVRSVSSHVNYFDLSNNPEKLKQRVKQAFKSYRDIKKVTP